MSTETGRWLQQNGLRPDLVLVTPTMRTRQTAEEILLLFSASIPTRETGLPTRQMEDWDALLESLQAELAEDGIALLVGHHPTMDMIKTHFGSLPTAIPRGNFASAVVLQSGISGWQCTAAWPGRPA
jgi:phosphohistidine phosphatase SixA